MSGMQEKGKKGKEATTVRTWGRRKESWDYLLGCAMKSKVHWNFPWVDPLFGQREGHLKWATTT